MASDGSSFRSASGATSFNFPSDNVLCSYDEYTPQLDQTAIGKRSDFPAKDLHASRVGRPSASYYSQQDNFSREDMTYAVEKCMKKYADILTRKIEGINERISQFELYCFKLEKAIGEFRSDMIHKQSEEDLKLKSIEKHTHEVHRSVQIIRDKQELSEVQMELAKLYCSQKEPSNLSSEGLTPLACEVKAYNDDCNTLAHRAINTDQKKPYKEPLFHKNQYHHPLHQPPLEQQRAQMPAHLDLPTNQQVNATTNQFTQPQPFAQYRCPQWPQSMQPQQPPSTKPHSPYTYAHYSPNQHEEHQGDYISQRSSQHNTQRQQSPLASRVSSFGQMPHKGSSVSRGTSPNTVFAIDGNRSLPLNFKPGS